jgi:ABC-type multidrug transport system ATPase subunit
MLPLEYHNVGTLNEREKVVNDSLESFKLIQFKNDRPAGIPGSARKATCVARAFIYSPQVLILDEPTQGLRHELNDVIINKMRALTKMNKNQFIIIASSDETFLQALRLSGFSVKTHSLMMNKEIAA